ncbi:MAG: DUF6065 family protein [Planctomycetota bacterium]|nr:DUF6065 family protein [Planctomycetota bacterium]
MSNENEFIAYNIYPNAVTRLEPSPIAREWMDNTDFRFAYRCLPMVLANQSGWILRTLGDIRVYWFGGDKKTDIKIEIDGEQAANSVQSIFGSGVITFTFPVLFRTPKGINLWVKGPSNWVKDGIHPLEGIVETDWSISTFTMNWKLTRVGQWIHFKDGEPCCMLVPIPRTLAENLEPRFESLENNQPLSEEYNCWQLGRGEFLKDLEARKPDAVQSGWQKDYFQGRNTSGEKFQEHQTKLALRPFTDK